MLFLRQQLQQSASRDMQHGVDRSAETLAIEGELAAIQQKSSEWHEERRELLAKILSSTGNVSNDPLTHKDKLLTNEVLSRSQTETYSNMNKMAQQQKEAIDALRKRQEERSKTLPRTAGDGCERKSAVERLFGSSSVKPGNGINNMNNQRPSASSSVTSAFQSPIARRIAEEVERASQVRKEVAAVPEAKSAPPIPPRTKAATPDVVKSTMPEKKSILDSIDNLFGAPEKIHIPERYIPDTVSYQSSSLKMSTNEYVKRKWTTSTPARKKLE